MARVAVPAGKKKTTQASSRLAHSRAAKLAATRKIAAIRQPRIQRRRGNDQSRICHSGRPCNQACFKTPFIAKAILALEAHFSEAYHIDDHGRWMCGHKGCLKQFTILNLGHFGKDEIRNINLFNKRGIPSPDDVTWQMSLRETAFMDGHAAFIELNIPFDKPGLDWLKDENLVTASQLHMLRMRVVGVISTHYAMHFDKASDPLANSLVRVAEHCLDALIPIWI